MPDFEASLIPFSELPEYAFVAGYDASVVPTETVIASTIPPTVIYSPSTGTTISATQSIQVDVADDSGEFCRVFIIARFDATGDWEAAFDGTNFSPRYRASSSVSTITNGFRYNVLRTGGWTATPTIHVIPIDAAGNEP